MPDQGAEDVASVLEGLLDGIDVRIHMLSRRARSPLSEPQILEEISRLVAEARRCVERWRLHQAFRSRSPGDSEPWRRRGR